jgi:hypothetical protein
VIFFPISSPLWLVCLLLLWSWLQIIFLLLGWLGLITYKTSIVVLPAIALISIPECRLLMKLLFILFIWLFILCLFILRGNFVIIIVITHHFILDIGSLAVVILLMVCFYLFFWVFRALTWTFKSSFTKLEVFILLLMITVIMLFLLSVIVL